LIVDLWHITRYNYNIVEGGYKMAKKSVTPSIRMSEEEYLKLKALKEKHGISWNELIAYANKVLSKEMNKHES